MHKITFSTECYMYAMILYCVSIVDINVQTVAGGHYLFLKIFMFINNQMCRDMTKPTEWLCAQRRLRSAWASAQFDQSLRCPREERLGPLLPTELTVKTLIRLGGS